MFNERSLGALFLVHSFWASKRMKKSIFLLKLDLLRLNCMPFTSTKAKVLAKSRKRDESGHFVKEAKIKIKASVLTPTDVKLNPEFEKPLVNIQITNPFKKILYWLDQIRRHQTTTFAIKLSIPLIALPVIIVGVFSLGRFYGINFQKAQTPPPLPPIIASPLPVQISRAGTLKIAIGDTMRYLLSLKNGELVVLEIPPTINLSKYQNKQVLVTGTYNKTSNILKVTDIAEIQVWNTLEIPESTQSAPPKP